MKYVIGIDQSTQGTKALLFDGEGRLLERVDKPHRQIISPEGYVSHDPEEIYQNVLTAVGELTRKVTGGGIAPDGGIATDVEIAAVGISNQRETTVAWNRETGEAVCDAVVWQCARGASVCGHFTEAQKQVIRQRTGIPLSPYFPAAKMRWILKNVPGAARLAGEGKLCMGTVDSYLLFRLTGGKEFRTDYSNASRTQLLNLHTLEWDREICEMFEIPPEALPEVTDSDALFGVTDFEGRTKEVPIRAMLGDSHGALFGQGCHYPGGVKATYGTGSSIMMNIGEEFRESSHGLVTSLAWKTEGKAVYVIEGNLNYTGAVVTWLKDDMKLISSAKETEALALAASPADTTYLVPAFSGLGAPYWKDDARALLCGMSRSTGRNEIVRAALDSIVYQITDILRAMEKDSDTVIERLCVDGGATGNRYLMQRQSDIANLKVAVAEAEELSGIGVAYLAGIGAGVYHRDEIFGRMKYETYDPSMEEEERQRLCGGWKEALGRTL